MIDLTLPGDALTASLVDVPSVSGGESRLADEVVRLLESRGGLTPPLCQTTFCS